MWLIKQSFKKNIVLGAFSFLFAVILFLFTLKFGDPAALPEAANFHLSLSLAENLFFSWAPILFSLISGIILLLTIILLHRSPQKSNCNYEIPTIPLLWTTLAFISLLGFINASCLDFPYLECSYLFGLAAFAIAIFRLLNFAENQHRDWLIAAVTISTILISLYGIYQYYSGLDETKNYVLKNVIEKGIYISPTLKARLFDSKNLVFSTFALSNSFAAHLILTTPLCLWFIYFKPKWPSSIKLTATIFTAFILIMVLFLTESRSAILSLFFAIILLIFILPFTKKIKFISLFSGILLGLLALFALRNKGFESFVYRLDYFQAALQMLIKHPFAGIGWGDFFHNYTHLKKLSNPEAPHMPHNFILSMGSQAGILALICSFAILVAPILTTVRRIIKAQNTNFYKRIEFPLLIGWTAWSFHSMLDVNIQIPATVTVAIFISGLMLIPGNNQKTNTPNKDTSTGKLFKYSIWNALALTLVLITVLSSLDRIPGEIALQNLNSLCTPFDTMTLKINKEKISISEIAPLLKTATELIPYSPFPWAIAGNYALNQQLWPTAEKYYSKAVSLSPERASFYYQLAISQFKIGRIKHSLQTLKEAKKLFPYKFKKLYNELNSKYQIK